MAKKFKKVKNQIDFVELEHEILKFWEDHQIFNKLVSKNEGNKPWSFMDGPITNKQTARARAKAATTSTRAII